MVTLWVLLNVPEPTLKEGVAAIGGVTGAVVHATVTRLAVVWAVTARPTLTVLAMVMVVAVPSAVQVPSVPLVELVEYMALNVLPVLVACTQVGRVMALVALEVVVPPAAVRTWVLLVAV